MTQGELGAEIGASGQTIYKYESGITFPPPKNIEKLLNFFHVTPNTLFGFEFDVNTDVLTVVVDLIANHFAQQTEIGKVFYEEVEKRAFEILCQYYPFLKDHDFQSAMDYDHVDFQLKLNQLITQG
jgi:Predicted transcriptional regulators